MDETNINLGQNLMRSISFPCQGFRSSRPPSLSKDRASRYWYQLSMQSRTTSPGAKLDVNGEINYVTNSTTRRVHNDISSNIKTSGIVYFGTSWGNVDTTYYKVDLPSVGTYLIYGTFRVIHDGDTGCFGKVRLYNNTDVQIVSNSTLLKIKQQDLKTFSFDLTLSRKYYIQPYRSLK